MPQRTTLPLDRLLWICRRLGYRVTSNQLHRWRAAGLLSRPRRIGQGRARGTISHYAEENILRILLLCDLLDRTRNLRDAGWTLWAWGFDVAPFVRRELVRLLVHEQQWAESVAEAERTGRALRLRPHSQVGRLIRQSRRDPSAGARMAGVLAATMRGTEVQDPAGARDLLDDFLATLTPRALRVFSPEQRAKLDEDVLVGEQPDVLEAFQILGREASPVKAINVLKRTTDEDLKLLRDELVAMRARMAAELGLDDSLLPGGADFLSYFKQRWISPTYRPAQEAFLDALKLRPLPPSPPLAQWLIEHKLPELIASATPAKRKKMRP